MTRRRWTLAALAVLLGALAWRGLEAMRDERGEQRLKTLATQVADAPTTRANMEDRARSLKGVLFWARERLPGTVKVEDTLVAAVEAQMARHDEQAACASLEHPSRKAWQQHAYFQNHNWICHTGLGLAGWALEGEFREADAWMAQAEANARAVLQAWSGVTDGSNHEGFSYWSYGERFLFITLDQIKHTRGENLFLTSPWLSAQAHWRAHGMLPNRSDVLALADCNRRESHGRLCLLRKLAAEYRDGIAEELARQIASARHDLKRASEAPWEFLWYDPSVAPKPLETLPRSGHFPDLGLVTARSDWGGDATFFSFKSGAPGGRSQFDHARAEYPNISYLDVGHDHPDQNSVTLFARGTYWLDDGGYDKPKLTSNHNTILVDGQGQIGEGRTWFTPTDFKILTEDRTARIVLYRDDGACVEVVGEAGRCYPEALGLKTFTRRAIFLRPDMVLVLCAVCWPAAHTRGPGARRLGPDGDYRRRQRVMDGEGPQRSGCPRRRCCPGPRQQSGWRRQIG